MDFNVRCVFSVIYLCFSLVNVVSLVPSLCEDISRAESKHVVSLVPSFCKDISRADPRHISYKFCVSELSSDPRSSLSTAAQLAEISFDLDISKARHISSTINTLMKQLTMNKSVRNALKDCSNLYSKIQDDLQAGLRAVKGEDYSKANVTVTAAMNTAMTCEDWIKLKKGADSSLKGENSEFYQLCAISLGFIKLLPIVNC